MDSYKTKLGTLYFGNTVEIIKSLPSNSFDAIITDPPFGLYMDEYDKLDNFLNITEDLYRVMKKDSWLIFYFATKKIFELTPLLKFFNYKWMIPYMIFGSKYKNPIGLQMAYNIVMVFSKGKPKIYYKRRDLMFADELPVVTGKINEPQFKPTYITSCLLQIFTKEGDNILDPFTGYGSIPLVCELYNRRWVGIEIDPIKFRIAKRIITDKKVSDIRQLKKDIEDEIKFQMGGPL